MSWSRSPARWRDDAAAAATPPRRASSSAAHQTRSAARLEPSTPATRHVAHWGRGGVGVGSSPLRDATNEDAAAASSPSPPPPPPPFAFKTTTYAPTPWTPPTPRDDVDDDAASDAISTLRRDAERARTLRNELRVLAVGASSSFSSSDATSGRLAAALLAKGDELARVCDGVVAASARVATTNARDRVDRSTDGDAAEARARRLDLELLDAKDALVARRRECVRLRVLAEEATAARDAASSGATRTREEKEKRSLAVGYAMARAKRRVELGRRFRAWSSWASRSLARRWCDARETRARATAKAFAGWRGRVLPLDREHAAAVVRAAAFATWRAAATRSSRELRETLDAVRASAATDVERAMERAAAAERSSVASLEKTRDVQDALEAFERHAAARDDAKTRELDAVRAQKADAREEIARLERRLSERASEAAVRSYSIHWSQTTASAW